jgi:2-aminoadipate transaminase
MLTICALYHFSCTSLLFCCCVRCSEALVALAARYDFTVLADEVYQLLSFLPQPDQPQQTPQPPPLCYYDTTGHVISMGSFAKIAAPALRLGWLQFSPAGAALYKRVYGCGQLDSSGGLNPVISGLLERFIDSGAQDAHVRAT